MDNDEPLYVSELGDDLSPMWAAPVVNICGLVMEKQTPCPNTPASGCSLVLRSMTVDTRYLEMYLQECETLALRLRLGAFETGTGKSIRRICDVEIQGTARNLCNTFFREIQTASLKMGDHDPRVLTWASCVLDKTRNNVLDSLVPGTPLGVVLWPFGTSLQGHAGTGRVLCGEIPPGLVCVGGTLKQGYPNFVVDRCGETTEFCALDVAEIDMAGEPQTGCRRLVVVTR